MPLTKTEPGFPKWCQAPMEKKQVWTKLWPHAGPEVNSLGVWFGFFPIVTAGWLYISIFLHEAVTVVAAGYRKQD